jgi:hypothetical protein
MFFFSSLAIMTSFEKEYFDFLNSKHHLFSVKNLTWNRLPIGIGFHSTLWNNTTNSELFFSLIGKAQYVDLGEKGNLGKFSIEENKAKFTIFLA